MVRGEAMDDQLFRRPRWTKFPNEALEVGLWVCFRPMACRDGKQILPVSRSLCSDCISAPSHNFHASSPPTPHQDAATDNPSVNVVPLRDGNVMAVSGKGYSVGL